MSVLSNVELVMWSPAQGTEPPLVEHVREALARRRLPPERAADIPPSTAFRRAVKAQEGKRDDGSETRATLWTKDGKTFAQLDQLTPEGERMRRERVAGWVLNGEVKTIEGTYALPLQECLDRYTWADVSCVIQNILKHDGMGAYSPKKTGGVYFVPMQGRELLDALDSAMQSVGLNLLRYQVPDTEAQRQEVGDAIRQSFEAEITEHAQAIDGYAAETRRGIVENRVEALRRTRELLDRLSLFVQGEAGAALFARISQLEVRCGEIIQAIAQAAATRPVAQGRRILTQSEVPH